MSLFKSTRPQGLVRQGEGHRLELTAAIADVEEVEDTIRKKFFTLAWNTKLIQMSKG